MYLYRLRNTISDVRDVFFFVKKLTLKGDEIIQTVESRIAVSRSYLKRIILYL